MRLTADEIRSHRVRLSQWQSPAEMRAAAEQLMDHLGCEDLFNQAGLDFVRETWVAGEFADKRRASSVRLIPDNRPDFELRLESGELEAFELVEAHAFGRERGLEY